jgi:transposase
MVRQAHQELKRSRRRYTAEFKEEAVRLALRGDRPRSQVARSLGVHDQVLRHWVRASQAGASGRENGSSPGHFTLEEENRRLRRELARAEEERDILKKATAYFAGQSR